MDSDSGRFTGLQCGEDSYCMDPTDSQTDFLHETDAHDFMTAEEVTLPPKSSNKVVPLVYIATILCALWVVYVNVARRYNVYKRKRELRDRRRRAGIPDEDDRPFDIAYAAAAMARRRETDERQKAEQEQTKLEAASNMPFTQMASSFDTRLPYNVRMQGLQPPSGLVHRQVTHPRARGFSPAPEVQSLRSQGTFLQPIQPQQSSLRYLYSNGDNTTIASSESPPGQGPPPPTWEDQYAPPSVRALNEKSRARQAAAAPTTSTLGRRSRKDLHFGNDSEIENEVVSRQQRLRTGSQLAKDADDEAKFIGRGHTRKRGQDAEDTGDHDNSRANPRRRVEELEDARTMPGALPEMQPAAAVAGKRKAAEEVEDPAEQDLETVQAPRKPRKKAKRGKEKADRDEGQTDPPAVDKNDGPSTRQPGEEWSADGVKYKMGENGEVLREAIVQERKTVVPVRDDRLSPIRKTPSTKTIYHSFTRSWLTQEAFEKAQKEGRISDVFDHDAFMAEVHRQSSPMQGSDMEDDLRSETGQTPLNTGAYRTKLGYDRPMPASPSLMNVMKQSADDLRRQHMQSPSRKNFVPSKRGATMTRTERARAEEEAWADVRQGWRRMNAKNTPTPTPAPSVVNVAPVASHSSNPFTPPAPSPPVSQPEVASVPKPAEPPSVPAVTVTPASAPITPAIATAPPAETTNLAPKPPLFTVKEPEKKEADPPKPPIFTMPSFMAPPNPSTSTSGVTSAPVLNGASKPPPFSFSVSKPPEPESKQPTPNPFSGAFGTNNSTVPATGNKSLFGTGFGNNNTNATPSFGSFQPTASASNTTPAAPEQKQPTNVTVPSVTSQATPQFQPFSMPTLAQPSQTPFQFASSSPFGSKGPSTTATPPTNLSGGAPVSQNAFGGSQPSSIGQNTGFSGVTGGAAPKFSFGGGAFGGGATSNSGSGGSFGGGNMVGPSASAPSGLFGGSGGGFGSQQQPAAAPGLSQPSSSGLQIFGTAKTGGDSQNNTTAKPSFSFGQTPAAPSASPFGQTPAAPSASPFGQTPAAPSASPFGQNTSNLFGNTASAASTPAATSTTFGNQQSFGFTFGANFGGPQNTTAGAVPSSPFGQPATPQANSNGQVPGSATAPVFNIGTPPPAQRAFKGMPRARR
ncbi:hypothetical protein FRB95_008798 [Tulasnella sp. JGI-2019a]|nr:hypothetical protein FRB95_008798 [Tulasnella sp. JGI-2019a]